MPGAFDFDCSSTIHSKDIETVTPIANNAKPDDDDEIVLEISDDPKFRGMFDTFDAPQPSQPQTAALAPGTKAAMHVPTPVHATNVAPSWLLTAANGNATTQSFAMALNPLDAQCASTASKGSGESGPAKAADPWSIFSPPPPVQQRPRPRYVGNATRYRALPSIGQALPDGKIDAKSREKGDEVDEKLRSLIAG